MKAAWLLAEEALQEAANDFFKFFGSIFDVAEVFIAFGKR